MTKGARPSLLLRRVEGLHVGTRIKRAAWLCELALWIRGWQTKAECISVSVSTCLLSLHSFALSKVLKSYPNAYLDVVLYVQGVLQDLSRDCPSDINDLWCVSPRNTCNGVSLMES